MRAACLSVATVLIATGCRSSSASSQPAAPGPATCPLEGCGSTSGSLGPSTSGLCADTGDAPCGGLPAERCTDDALAAWAEARDDRAVACIARKLVEACSLDDRRACAFAGRLLVDGRGAPRDPSRGVRMLVRACDGGLVLACAAGIRSLSDPTKPVDLPGAVELRARLEIERSCFGGQADACYQAALEFYNGKDSFPLDQAGASACYSRGCDLGEARSCNNLGDGLEYGVGVARDIGRAFAAYGKACRLGEAIGCANLGRLYESGAGTQRDLARARVLYHDACLAGEGYGCLHAEMLAARSAGAPWEGRAALDLWRIACDRKKDRRACAFVGLLYEDGPDGANRDESRSLQAMARACQLGEPRACDWVKSRPAE